MIPKIKSKFDISFLLSFMMQVGNLSPLPKLSKTYSLVDKLRFIPALPPVQILQKLRVAKWLMAEKLNYNTNGIPIYGCSLAHFHTTIFTRSREN